MLDAIDGLDDGLKWLGNELHGIVGFQPIRRDEDIDHRHGNLRLFLPRQRNERDQAQRQACEQEQLRQWRCYEEAGKMA